MSMDFYFSGQDSLSLQEMIDFDTKREYDDYNSIDFELGASVQPLELDENSVNGLISTTHASNGLHMWLNGHATANSSPLSNSNYNLDFMDGDAEAAMMVDPHNVIPIDLFKAEPRFSDEPVIKQEPVIGLVKQEPQDRYSEEEPERERALEFEPKVEPPQESRVPSTIINKCKLKAKANIIRDNLIIPTNLVSSMAVNRLKNGSDTVKSNVQSMPKTLATIRIGRPDDASLITSSGSTVKSLPVTIVTTSQNSLSQIKIVEGSVKTLTPVAVQTKKVISVDKKSFGIHRYPKPAYSYSCLIAMALKNSKSGSLPVSEIYNFMCNHFPYFKTAPSGWKNSVRHNLSLNQCFEKIEKPMTNSGASRKGCLWAMNPDKIAKMDAEVQKWSKKDPMAIKKAMVYPENLEALERGELKVGSFEDHLIGEESEEYEEDTAEEDDDGVDAEDDVDIDVDDTPVSTSETYLYNGAVPAIDLDSADMEVEKEQGLPQVEKEQKGKTWGLFHQRYKLQVYKSNFKGDLCSTKGKLQVPVRCLLLQRCQQVIENGEGVFLTTKDGQVILNYNSDSEVE